MKNLLSRLGAAAILAAGLGQQATAAELTFWSWRQEDRAAYQEIIADFSKLHPGIDVSLRVTNKEQVLASMADKELSGRGV